MTYYKMEDFDEALKYFAPLSKQKGEKKETSHLFVGLCYYKKKDYEKAIKIFEKIYYEGEDIDVAEQAKKFLRKARALKKFEDRKAKWFEASATLGYISNTTINRTNTTFLNILYLLTITLRSDVNRSHCIDFVFNAVLTLQLS